MKLRVVPDAYRYLMAKGMLEIQSLKWDEPQGMARLKSIYAGCKAMKKQMLIQVTLSLVDRESFLIFKKKPAKSCFGVHQGYPLTFSVKALQTPDYEKWEVFEYPPGAAKIISKMPLWVTVKETSFHLTAMAPRAGGDKPLRVVLENLAVQKKSADFKDSINRAERQLSLRLWKDIDVPEAILSFGPGQLKMPEPPEGLEELLQRVENEKT